MNKKFIKVVRHLLRFRRYVLVAVDTTFFGRTAVILVKIDHGSATMYVSDKESTRSVSKAIEFLREIEAKYHDRLIFLQDGSTRIYKAIIQNFKAATVIRQFHNEEALGLVHVHFTYNGERYTLALRWDHFVEERDVMALKRGVLRGEALLQKDEVVLYAGTVMNPNYMLAEELEQRVNWCIGMGLQMEKLPERIKQDYDRYYNAKGRSTTISLVARAIYTFQRYKRHVIEYARDRCEMINNAIMVGLQELLDVDFSEYLGRYLLKLYRGLKVLTLCNPRRDEHERFRRIKRAVLQGIEVVLMADPIWGKHLNGGPRRKGPRSNSRYGRVELFRGKFSNSVAEGYPELAYILEILEKIFKGKYITTNIVEGYFGRVKSSVMGMRNVTDAEESIWMRLEAPSVGITNRFSELLELLDLLSFDEYRRIKGGMKSEEAGGKSSRCVMPDLEEGSIYLIHYHNRSGEEKVHLVLVENKTKRRSTKRDTYYEVTYLTTEGLRDGEAKVKRKGIILRGDRIRSMMEMELEVIH